MTRPEKKRTRRIFKKTVFRRLAVMMIRAGMICFLLLFLLISLLYLPPVQNWITGKVEQFLSEKLSTKVEAGGVHLNFAAQLVINDLYLEDQQQDTLWSSKTIYLDIPVYPLFKQQLLFRNIDLHGVKSKYIIFNTEADSTNLDFILNAFGSGHNGEESDSNWRVDASAISLHDVDLLYDDRHHASQVHISLGSLEIASEQSDLGDLKFHLSKVQAQNTTVTINNRIAETNTLATNRVEADISSEVIPLLARIDQVALKNCMIHYSGPIEAENINLQLGEVQLEDFVIDGEKYQVQSKIFSVLDSRLAIATLSSEQDTTAIIAPLSLNMGWSINLSALEFENNSFLYYQKSSGDTLSVPDFTLDVSQIHLAVSNLSVSHDTLRANVEQLVFYENTGMELQECKADLFLCDEKLDIQDLKIKTPYSEISAGFAVQSSSLFLFSQTLAELRFTAQIHPSTIGRHDLQYFVPEEVDQIPDINLISLEADIEGSINDIAIHHFRAQLDQEVFVGVSGKLRGLPDLENTSAEMDIHARYLSQTGLKKILVRELPFDRKMLPAFMALKGRIEGTKDDFTSNLHLTSSVGKAEGLLSYRNVPARKDAFHCTLAFSDFDLEKIYPPAAISHMKGKLDISGTGLVNKQYDIQSTLRIDSLTYDNYSYQNIRLQAQYEQQEAFAQLQMDDPHLQFSGEGHWTTKDSVQQAEVDMSIGEADLYALHFTNSPFLLKGNVSSQLSFGDQFMQLTADLKDMEINKSSLYRVNDIHLTSAMQENFFDVKVDTDFFQGAFESSIHPAELPPLLISHFRSYLSAATLPEDSMTKTGYYRLKFSFDDRSAIGKLLPGIEDIKITTFESSFDAAQKEFQFLMDIPYIKYEGIGADSLLFDIRSDKNSMKYLVNVPSVGTEELSVKNLSLSGDLLEGKFNNQISIKDSLQQAWYNIAFLLEGAKDSAIALSLVPEQTLLNYERWSAGEDNQILFQKNRPAQGGLSIVHQQQALGVQLLTDGIQMNTTDLPLELFTSLVQNQESEPLASGLLNGKASVQQNEDRGKTAVEMNIRDCRIMGTNLGYIETVATSFPGEKLEWMFLLKNENNTATLKGSYSYAEDPLPLTLQFDLDFKNLSVFESFANGEITGLKGQIISEISAAGNLDNINAEGRITFQEAAFDVKQLNNRFHLEDETITLNNTGLGFNNFSLRDATENQFVINGKLITQDYRQFTVDMNVIGNQFTVINSTAKENPEFFGALVMSAKARLQGQLPDLRVAADLSIDEGTHLTYVMPPSEINMVSDEGIVEFIDPTHTLSSDSLDIAEHIAAPMLTQLSGIDLVGNLNIHKEASFRVDIDPRSGDYATVNGEGKLNIGMIKGQNFSLTGNYEITQGIYEVSFYNLAKKTFQIEEGSLLNWTGDPYHPLFDMRAYNVIRTASTGLVANEIAGLTDDAKRTYQKPLPYKVEIFIKGDPISTDLGFSIGLPDEDKVNYPVVASKLQRLNEKGNESMLTQQVFGLLTIGSFIPERTANVGGDYSVAFASTAAVNSLNGILTNELNKLSGQYLKGIDVDFGLQSSQDLSSGSLGMTTMMDIKVSKTLFNERMKLEAQSSFDVNGNSNYSSTQNDIAIVYNLTNKGDYKLKTFNVSSYDVVYKDIRTSGISLIFVKEYDPVKKKKHKKSDHTNIVTEEDDN